jgi:adenosylmethionine-8-amino-7-oxononanoate aminotransferase
MRSPRLDHRVKASAGNTSAVSLETLKIYEDLGLLSHVRAIAPQKQAGLRDFADHPLVGEVRGHRFGWCC